MTGKEMNIVVVIMAIIVCLCGIVITKGLHENSLAITVACAIALSAALVMGIISIPVRLHDIVEGSEDEQ